METDNIDVLGDCIVSLNNCNQSLSHGIKSIDRILHPDDQEDDEFQRLARIIRLKKVYKIYPISYINEQISDYNSIKNNRILASIETIEKLNELKYKEKENQMGFVELLQNRLEQFVNHKKRENTRTSIELSASQEREDLEEADNYHHLTDEEKKELEILQEQIDTYRFQVSKIQLQKSRRP
ncbi:hypothetical protein DASC09_012520 [Saccharomycopsis crataegensis]|uniref:DASH complex subunit SPC19 n=1 Tax=Saccharomycopsis crataegensis TaxID=43959 RepID=A0AAV5QGL9_9ASCO|nr:hypothetical protein DASC09_012520 [Saccharomycopsis crataegensis]